MSDADDFKEMLLAEFNQMGLVIARFTTGELSVVAGWYYEEKETGSVAENLGKTVDGVIEGLERLAEPLSPEWEHFRSNYGEVGRQVSESFREGVFPPRPKFERAMRKIGRAFGKLGIGEELFNHAAFQFSHAHIAFTHQYSMKKLIERHYDNDPELKRHVEYAPVYANHVRWFVIDFARAAGDLPHESIGVFANQFAHDQAILNWGKDVDGMEMLSIPSAIPKDPIEAGIQIYEREIRRLEAELAAEIRAVTVELSQNISDRQTEQQTLNPSRNPLDALQRIRLMRATERDHRLRRQIESSTIPKLEEDLAFAKRELDLIKRLKEDAKTIQN